MQTVETTETNCYKLPINGMATCKVTVRVCRVESGGKWSFTPGSEVDTSSAPAAVREQLSFTGRDTAINQENWHTALQASCRCNKRETSRH